MHIFLILRNKMPWIVLFHHWKWEKYAFIIKFRKLKMPDKKLFEKGMNEYFAHFEEWKCLELSHFINENAQNMHSSSNFENWRCDEKSRWMPIFLILKYENALNWIVSFLQWKWEKYAFITKFRLLKMRKLKINYIII